MAERDLVVEQQRFAYDGVFDLEKLYVLITEWFEEKGYDQREMKNDTRILPDGNFHQIWIRPWKKVTDYHKYDLDIRMVFDRMKPVTVGGKKLTHGRIRMVFDAGLTYDYDEKWETHPMFVFIRTLFDKYFYKSYSEGMKEGLRKDLADVQGRIRAFLNVYKR